MEDTEIQDQVDGGKSTGFEVYVPRQRGTSKAVTPKVRLSKMTIVLDKNARALLDNPEHVELAFDKDNKIIRIIPSDTGAVVKKTKVFAQGFYKAFEISASGKYDSIFDENDKALFVKLSA